MDWGLALGLTDRELELELWLGLGSSFLWCPLSSFLFLLWRPLWLSRESSSELDQLRDRLAARLFFLLFLAGGVDLTGGGE
jgi:hypothetical protein